MDALVSRVPFTAAGADRLFCRDLAMAEDQSGEDGHASHSAEPSEMDQNDRDFFRVDQNSDVSMRRPRSSSSIIANESARLRELEAGVRDQDDLERDIARQVGWLYCCNPSESSR